MIAQVFKNNELIAEGQCDAFKGFSEEAPEEHVALMIDGKEVDYDANETTHFKIFTISGNLLYDSETKKTTFPEEELTVCTNCGRTIAKSQRICVTDKYNIPYKTCCIHCHKEVEKEIGKWIFDPSTGEHLEEED